MSPVCPIDVQWLAEEAAIMGKARGVPQRPLIAGGSGLVGSNLLVLLANTPDCERVRVLDLRPPSPELLDGIREKVEFVQLRLGSDSYETLLEALEGVDCVFSVITPHVQLGTAEDFKLTNTDGVALLTRACEDRGVGRLVHLSSIAVTNHFANSTGQRETDPLPKASDYVSPYDRTKRAGEEIVLSADRDGALRTCSIRAGGIVLSPYDFSFRNLWPVIPGLVVLPRGQPIDFIDGRDVARSLLLAAQGLQERPAEVAGEAFFVTKGGEPMAPGDMGRFAAGLMQCRFLSLPDLAVQVVMMFACVVHFMQKAMGHRVPGIPPHQYMSMMFYRQTFDNTKALEVLRFTPKVSLKEAITRIIDVKKREGKDSLEHALPTRTILNAVIGLAVLVLAFMTVSS